MVYFPKFFMSPHAREAEGTLKSKNLGKRGSTGRGTTQASFYKAHLLGNNSCYWQSRQGLRGQKQWDRESGRRRREHAQCTSVVRFTGNDIGMRCGGVVPGVARRRYTRAMLTVVPELRKYLER